MQEKITIKKFTDGTEIDISVLSIQELKKLQYQEERCCADLIRQSAPFSDERAKLMNNGYNIINQIKHLYESKEGKKQPEQSYNRYIYLIKSIVSDVLKKKNKCMFFEAGVGNGIIIKNISLIKGVYASGCDVYVDNSAFKKEFNILEGTIYNTLKKVKDNSIDVFYWSNVMEHIPEDEIEEHIKLIHSKLSTGGILITVVPNRLTGPHDITKHFEKHSIAKGFHFKEWTFTEVLRLYNRYNMTSAYGIWLGFTGIIRGKYYVLKCAKTIDFFKCIIEKLISIGTEGAKTHLIRRVLLTLSASYISVVKKNDKQANI